MIKHSAEIHPEALVTEKGKELIVNEEYVKKEVNEMLNMPIKTETGIRTFEEEMREKFEWKLPDPHEIDKVIELNKLIQQAEESYKNAEQRDQPIVRAVFRDMVSFRMAMQQEPQIPIAAMLSCKDAISVWTLVQAKELAEEKEGKAVNNLHVQIVDMPIFQSAEMPDVFRKTESYCAQHGIEVERYADVPTINELDTLFPGWDEISNPPNQNTIEVAKRIKHEELTNEQWDQVMQDVDPNEAIQKMWAWDICSSLEGFELADDSWGNGLTLEDKDRLDALNGIVPGSNKSWRIPNTEAYDESTKRAKKTPTARAKQALEQVTSNTEVSIEENTREEPDITLYNTKTQKYTGPILTIRGAKKDRNPDVADEVIVNTNGKNAFMFHPILDLEKSDMENLNANVSTLKELKPGKYVDGSRGILEIDTESGELIVKVKYGDGQEYKAIHTSCEMQKMTTGLLQEVGTGDSRQIRQRPKRFGQQ